MKNIDFSYQCRYDDVIPLSIPFVAEYQVMNMALACQALLMLAVDFSLERSQITAGLKSVRWAGRMQMVRPEVYFDGAHNTDGILEFSFCNRPPKSWLFIFGLFFRQKRFFQKLFFPEIIKIKPLGWKETDFLFCLLHKILQRS